MKRIVSLAVFVSFAYGLIVAQSPIRWGVEAGLNLSKPTEATQTDCGFNVGVTGELSLSKGWFLDAALKLTSQPWTIDSEYRIYEQPITQKHHASMTPYSLIIPIHAGYSFGVGSATRLYVAVGPYIGYGLFGGGHIDSTIIEDGVSKTDTWNIDNPYSRMKRFQLGGDARIGAEFCGHYTVTFGYQLQFNNMMRKFDTCQRAQTFSINLGYKF